MRILRLAAVAALTAAAAFASFRLFLKDGGHHTVREYEVDGARVRYYSTERGEWEEIPLDLVDLVRTEKVRRESDARLAAEEKTQAEEDAAERALAREIRRVPAEPGVYLVAGEGLKKIAQIDVEYVTDKKRSILKAITPLPFISGKATFEVKGERSVNAVAEKRPEFYVRQSAEESIAIFRMGARKGNRVVEHVQVVPVSKELIEEPDVVETFRRQFAEGLYKIWPTADLTPGEYGVVQFTMGKGNPQVWDFRVE
jgi:hypothetical protein